MTEKEKAALLDFTSKYGLMGFMTAVIAGFSEYGLGFRMVMEGKPTLVWDFNSLKTVMETVYGFMMSDADQPLRICKRCCKVFFATHGRTEFCSGRCRNQYNVYKSRSKGKDEQGRADKKLGRIEC